MAKKLKKYQGTENSEVINRDAANNKLIAYFNSLERRGPGPTGDGPPSFKPVIEEEEESNTITYDNLNPPKGRPVVPNFKDGGSWERLGKSKFKKPKYKKDKKTKPNRKGLY